MPSFTRTLFGIAPLCNTNLTIIFTKNDIKAINKLEPPSSKVGVILVEPTTGIFPSSTPTITAMRTPSSLLMMNSPAFFPPNLLQNLYSCQQHQSPTPTGTALGTRGGQLVQYS
jgi:hypothetical protein